MRVVAAQRSDLPAIVELFNHYILHSHVTFYNQPFDVAARIEWFEQFADRGRHQLLVAKSDSGQLLGYAGSGVYRKQGAYDKSVEVSVYVSDELGSGGIGTTLYRELFANLQSEDVHRALAGIAIPNPASMALHKKFDFQDVGIFREVGYKFGQYWDVAWLEKRFR